MTADGGTSQRPRRPRLGAALCVLALSLLASSTALAASSEHTPVTPAAVSQWVLPEGDFYPGSIVAGRGGAMWFANSREEGDGFRHEIDRIDASGEITPFGVRSNVWDLTRGPGGIWFVRSGHVGRIKANGQIKEFPVSTGYEDSLAIAAGAGGYLWLTKRFDQGRDAIQRITRGGKVKQFKLPKKESGPRAITPGPDGAMWFSEYFGERIGRMSATGEITEFPVGVQPFGGIASGPEGNLWFITFGEVGRLTPTGRLTMFEHKGVYGSIVAGPDGRIWFPNGYGSIGRLTPGGRFSEIRLPNEAKGIAGLAVGPEGHVWYTAEGDYPCYGGSSCFTYKPEFPGVVGEITPGPLEVAITGSQPSRKGGWVRIGVRCRGGDAGEVCAGTLRLSSDGAPMAGGRFRVGVDVGTLVSLRLASAARAALRGQESLAVTATATARTGEAVTRELVLRR